MSVDLYVLVALSAVSVLGWQQLSVSTAPLADVVSATLGADAAIVISVIALFATANTVLMSMYASSRILYGMAGSSDVTARLAWIHPVRRTPWIAIRVCGGLSLLLIFAGDIAFIANVTNFTLFITFIVINAAVIVFGYHSPQTPRPFRIPLSIGRLPLVPVAGIFFCIFLLSVQDPERRVLNHEHTRFWLYALQEVTEPNLQRAVFPYDEVCLIDFDHKILPISPAPDRFITDTTFRDGQQARPPFTVQQIVDLFDLLHRLSGPHGVVRQTEFFLYSARDREAVADAGSGDTRTPKSPGGSAPTRRT